MRPLLMVVMALALVACVPKNAKPQIVATTPVAVKITQRVYVPIDSKLTAPLAVPEGSLAQCPDVAKARRSVIEILLARLTEISKVQGSEVPAGK